jgi:signal transduction histidine kinase
MDPSQTNLPTAVLMGALIIGVIILFFFISVIRHQRRRLELQQEAVLAEITTLEAERTRMSKDLHDEYGPMLTLVKLKLESITGLSPEVQQQVREAGLQIDELMNRLRATARHLMPSILVRKGLVPALDEFINDLNETTSLHIDFHTNITHPLERTRTINIYRILQEIITNTLKYARARELLIELSENPKELLIFCADDGIGFDRAQVLEGSGGLGLRNIQSRVEIMGGQWQLHTEPGKGTQYKITLPNEYV